MSGVNLIYFLSVFYENCQNSLTESLVLFFYLFCIHVALIKVENPERKLKVCLFIINSR